MKVSCEWKQKLELNGVAGRHSVAMDTQPPLGTDSGPSPKQLLLMAVCGCTAMDVVALLKKNKQEVTSFTVEAEASVADTHPMIFTEIRMTFRLQGAIERERALEAVNLSQTKFCSVSAMVSKAVPILYVVEVNGAVIGQGKASF